MVGSLRPWLPIDRCVTARGEGECVAGRGRLDVSSSTLRDSPDGRSHMACMRGGGGCSRGTMGYLGMAARRMPLAFAR